MAERECKEKLVALRRENHMTQSGLANKLNVTRQTVYKWETGQSYPEAMTLFAMRNLFGVPTDILLDKSVTLAEYRQSLAKTGAAVLNAVPMAEVPMKGEVPAKAETAAPEKAAEPAPVAPAAPEKEAETKPAAAEPEKKKKGLFSRLFNR